MQSGESGFYRRPERGTIRSQRLGELQLEERVGLGGMAEIWRATADDGRVVAVKLLTPERAADETARRRFARECAITMDLRHAKVARGLDQGICDGRQYLVVEYVEGPTLEELIASSQKRSKSQVASILRSICSVLIDFHSREIYHRDLKPANVMLSPGQDGSNPRLIDFGIASAPDFATLTKDREILGTLQYMTPEQIYGSPIDPLDIDLWGLSALAYETLTGHPAFDAPSLGELCAAIRNGKHRRPSELRGDLDPCVDAFFARCFAQQIDQRFRNVSEWLVAFEGALGFAPAPQRNVHASDSMVRFPRLPDAFDVEAANDLALPVSKARRVRRWFTVAAAALFFTGIINVVDLGHLAAQWSCIWP